jgi:WD40 repeat protein
MSGKRCVTAAVTLVMASVWLGACGGGAATPTTTSPPPAASPTALQATRTVAAQTPARTPLPISTPAPCGGVPPSELGGTWESQPPLIPTGPVPEGAVLRLGKGGVYAIATAPDGEAIAIATDTGLTVFSAPDLQEIWSVYDPTYPYPMVGRYKWVEPGNMQFSQDGSVIKVTREDDNLYFDAQDGTLLESDMVPEDQPFIEPVISECVPEEYEERWIFHQATSVDGAFAAGSGTYSGLIHVFDNSTCELLNEFEIGGGEHFLSWLPARPGECGGALLTASSAGTLAVWDPWSGEKIRAGGFGMGPQLAWSPDGSILAVGADTLAVLVDVDTMTIADALGADRIPRFKPILGEDYWYGVTSINWASNDRLVIAGRRETFESTVMTWTPQTGAEWYVLPLRGSTGFPPEFALSPDGQLLASTGYKSDDSNVYATRLWEVHSGALLWTVEMEYPQSCRGLTWSPDGTRLVCYGHDQSILFDIDTGQMANVLSQSLYFPRTTWSPDGVHLAINPWLEGYTVVWDTEHDEHFTLEGIDNPSWSPDGRWIAGAGADNTVVVWDLQQRALTHTLEYYNKCDYSEHAVVAWSPDGTLLASGSPDWSITIFDVAEERPVKRLEGHAPHPRSIVNLAWSPDGRLLASVAGDLTLIIWDVFQDSQ